MGHVQCSEALQWGPCTGRPSLTHTLEPSVVRTASTAHTQGSGTQVTREMETQALITALALPHGGKILFAATEAGVVRCYKYPLTGASVDCPPRLSPGRCSTNRCIR